MAPQARVRRGGLAVAGVVLVVAGVVIGFVGKRTADGRLARNGFAGIRTERSMADDESWLIVHRRARPWMYASAAAMVVGGLCALVVRSDVAAAVAVLAAAVASVLLMVGGTMAGHRELARRRG